MNLILFSVTTFAVLDYFYRFMRFVSTDLAKIAKFLCFYSKSGLKNERFFILILIHFFFKSFTMTFLPCR